MTAIRVPRGTLQGLASREYKVVAGVIRNDGAAAYWYPLTTLGHEVINVDSVSTDATTITIDYTSIGATRVHTFVIVPDETLAAAGFFCGSSVSGSQAVVTLARQNLLTDLIYYDGAAWQKAAGGGSPYTVSSFTNGLLTLTHSSIGSSDNTSIDLTERGGAYRAVVSADVGSWNDTTIKIEFYNQAGNLVLTPDANMRVFVERPMKFTYDPRNVTTTSYPNSNLWFFGVFS